MITLFAAVGIIALLLALCMPSLDPEGGGINDFKLFTFAICIGSFGLAGIVWLLKLIF